MARLAGLHSHFLMWAGGTRFVFEVARRINRSVPVDMVVERTSDEVRDMFRGEGMNVIEIASRSSNSMAYWGLFPFHLAADIRRARALAGRYDAFISSMFPMSYVAARAGLRPYATYVMEPFAFFHDEDMIQGFPRGRRELLRLLAATYKRLDVEGVRRSDVVMTINAGTADWTRKVYGRESLRSLLGVDTTFFSPRPPTALASRHAGRKLIVHSTDFTPLKRTSDAIAIMTDLRRDVRAAKLLITCSSENPAGMATLKQQIAAASLEGHVEILGRVPHAELPDYYALADASLYTGVGKGASAASLFVLEAMACGTPGVRTNFTTDEIEHGKSGFLYSPGDSSALKAHLTTLLTDDRLCARFGDAARAHVVANYQWDAVAQRILEGLRGIAPSLAVAAPAAGAA